MSQVPAAATPRVTVFGLGGTIAMIAAHAGGVAPALTAEQLVAAVPALTHSGIDVDVVDFRSRPGASLTFDDLSDLAAHISNRCHADDTAAVITQGTDTIEEIAYLLDLFHRRPEPIVVTGAMRNPTQAGADGPANPLKAHSATAHTSHLLAATVQFLTEMVIVEVTYPPMRRVQQPDLYNVPLLRFAGHPTT